MEQALENDLRRCAITALAVPLLGLILPVLNHPVGTSLVWALVLGALATVVILVAGMVGFAPVLNYADPSETDFDTRDPVAVALMAGTVVLGLVASTLWAPGDSKISLGWTLIHLNAYLAVISWGYSAWALRQQKQAAEEYEAEVALLHNH